MRSHPVSKSLPCLNAAALTLLFLFRSPFAFAEQQQKGRGESPVEQARGRTEAVLGRSQSGVAAETEESATQARESLVSRNPENSPGRPDKLAVMRSGTYYFGQSVSMSRDEALQNSKADLINKIVTRVVSQASQGFSEDDEAYRSYYNQTTQTASRLELRGLDYLIEQRRDDSYEVTSFISKSDFEQSLEKETERQTGLFRSARRIEQEQGLNQAIPWYYSAYLNTFFFPDLLLLEVEEGETADAQTWYRNRIQEWVSELDFEVERPTGGTVQDLFQAEVPLSIQWKGEPVRALTVGLDLPDYGKTRTVGGRTSLFIDRLPERRRPSYRIAFQPVLEETPLNRDLNELALKTGPVFQREVKVDFGEMVRVDMGVKKLSDTAIRFTPELRNLSVAQFEWMFGAAGTSSEQSPTLLLRDVEEPMEVVLRVNGQPDLQIRRIYADGHLTDPDNPAKTTSGTARPVASSVKESDVTAESAYLEENRMPPPSADVPEPTREALPSERSPVFPVPDSRTLSEAEVRDRLDGLSLSGRSRSFVRRLSGAGTIDDLQGMLVEMSRVESIRSGGRQAVPNPSRSFIAIVDPADRTVKAFLTPEVAGLRTDLRTGRDVRELAETYKGYGPIFIQFL